MRSIVLHRPRRVLAVTILGSVGVAVSVLGWTALHHNSSLAAHAQSAGCSNASFNGSYGSLAWGDTVLGADGAPLDAPVPAGGVALIVADGAGSLTRTGGAVNSAGMVGQTPATGTYSVNPDCTFTVTYTGPTGATTHNAGVLVAAGTRAFVVTADPARVVQMIWERQ